MYAKIDPTYDRCIPQICNGRATSSIEINLSNNLFKRGYTSEVGFMKPPCYCSNVRAQSMQCIQLGKLMSSCQF